MKEHVKTFFDSILADPAQESGPHAFYNPDGDCIQFMAKPGSYRGKRINRDVTVYISLETGEVVGAMVKGVKALIKRCSAIVLVINDHGHAPLEQLLFLGLWLEKFEAGDFRVPLCRQILQMAKQSDLDCDVSPAISDDTTAMEGAL